jgi:hypothetical protein
MLTVDGEGSGTAGEPDIGFPKNPPVENHNGM